VIGYVGSVGAALMWIPQAVSAVRGRRDPAPRPMAFVLGWLVGFVDVLKFVPR
jgi:hypothetical protein